MKLSKLYSAQAKMEEGYWTPSKYDGLRHRLRGAKSIIVEKKREQLISACMAANGSNKELTPSQIEEMSVEIIVDTIWIDSEGLEDDDGAPINLTRENKEGIIRGSKLLRDEIEELSSRLDRIILREKEDAAKN